VGASKRIVDFAIEREELGEEELVGRIVGRRSANQAAA
jgi:hypothetical protein